MPVSWFKTETQSARSMESEGWSSFNFPTDGRSTPPGPLEQKALTTGYRKGLGRGYDKGFAKGQHEGFEKGRQYQRDLHQDQQMCTAS